MIIQLKHSVSLLNPLCREISKITQIASNTHRALASNLLYSTQTNTDKPVASNVNESTPVRVRIFHKDLKFRRFPRDHSEVHVNNLTIEVNSSSLAVLNSYMKFAKIAAKCLEIEVTEDLYLNPLAKIWTLLKSPFKYKKHMVKYSLKTFRRILGFKYLTGTTADIYLEYIQRNIPAGISMRVERIHLQTLPKLVTKVMLTPNKTLTEANKEERILYKAMEEEKAEQNRWPQKY